MIAQAKSIPGLGFSWTVLLTLVLVLTVSVVVFNWQVRRWTANPRWRALLDWARERGFKLSNQEREAPDPFAQIAGARISTSLEGKQTHIFQLESLGGSAVETPRWHVLTRNLETAWPPTGLRPVNATASLLDQFSLSSYPRLGSTDRFMVFGTETAAAVALSKSQARALLPPDIGLLLAGGKLVLDFSTRPFDSIECGRMTALAEQLVAHLPPPTAT